MDYNIHIDSKIVVFKGYFLTGNIGHSRNIFFMNTSKVYRNFYLSRFNNIFGNNIRVFISICEKYS